MLGGRFAFLMSARLGPIFGLLGTGDGKVSGGEHREGDVGTPGTMTWDLELIQEPLGCFGWLSTQRRRSGDRASS